MLEKYFEDSRIIKRMHQGPFSDYIDEFAAYLNDQGYSYHVIREYARYAAHWSRYVMWCGGVNIMQMDHASAREFVEEHLPNCSCERMNSGKYANGIAATDHVLRFLMHKGCIPPKAELPETTDEKASILRRYDQYLDELFGLCQKTRNIHRRMAVQFMQWLTEKKGVLLLAQLTTEDIVEYQELCHQSGFSYDWKRTLMSCFRGFLRFLRWEHILEKDLTPAVYSIRQWNLATVPKYMTFEDVKLLLSAPDRNTDSGKRDIAMLMLMAYLGLRANEVVNLQIDDVNFAKGTLLIRKTKTQKERVLPLTEEIGEILLDYIKNGRKPSPELRLFLRTVAPYTPLIAPSGLGTMIRKYIKQTGIKTPTLGTHQLRHSLATHLVNNGVTLKEIADLLGHSSLESTMIYAKVQVTRLLEVALPIPTNDYSEGGATA